MPRTNGYVGRDSKTGEFSCTINKDVNKMLDIYCRINGFNKTRFVNDLIRDKMEEVYNKLKDQE